MGVVCSPCNVGALAHSYHDVEFVSRLLDFLSNSPASRLGIVARADESQVQDSKVHAIWDYRSNVKKVPGGKINMAAFE